MCEPTTIAVAALALTAVGTAVAVKGSMDAADAAKNQAAYQAAVLRNNQEIARRAAADAIERGKAAEADKARQISQLQGRQRAALAGNGVLVDNGTALDVTSDTAARGKFDELMIRHNADREAYGYDVQGNNFDAAAGLSIIQGQNASRAAGNTAFSGGLSGLGTVAEKWYKFDNAGAFTSTKSTSYSSSPNPSGNDVYGGTE